MARLETWTPPDLLRPPVWGRRGEGGGEAELIWAMPERKTRLKIRPKMRYSKPKVLKNWKLHKMTRLTWVTRLTRLTRQIFPPDRIRELSNMQNCQSPVSMSQSVSYDHKCKRCWWRIWKYPVRCSLKLNRICIDDNMKTLYGHLNIEILPNLRSNTGARVVEVKPRWKACSISVDIIIVANIGN